MALQSMVTRKDVKGRVWGEKQRISIEEALKVCTINGAYASFEEEIKGSLTPGKLADFVLLDADPVRQEPEALQEIIRTYPELQDSVARRGHGGAAHVHQQDLQLGELARLFPGAHIVSLDRSAAMLAVARRRGVERLKGALDQRQQLPFVVAGVGQVMGDDELVRAVHGALHVVTDHRATALVQAARASAF